MTTIDESPTEESAAPALPDLFDLVVTLVKRGVYVGPRYSVGVYTPAVPPPSGHGWAVLNLQGAPVVLAHDAHAAALDFLRMERFYTPGDEDAELYLHPTDEDIAYEAQTERMERYGMRRAIERGRGA